jgi:IS5 family transposase
MFKILILQRLYNLSDEQMEYQINDRLSFMRFLGLNISDTIPDQNTIWLFRENLTRGNVIEKLFKKFDAYLDNRGIIAHKGSIVDASFVEAPRQRNSKEENDKIKNNTIPEEWQENPNKFCQKDTDARWTKKHGINHYGYKNHIKIDRKTKLIRTYKTTSANIHDSQVLKDLLNKQDAHHELYGDSAYSGEPIRELLKKKKIRTRIHEKGYRASPLTEKQKEKNRKKSKSRARVEHVFGFIKNSMKGSCIKAIGIERNDGIIGLMNLTYNMCRFIQLCRT